jgi:ribonuclease P protein component
LFLVGPEKYRPKCAVVVGKKKIKRAVDRNRIRRQLYEMIRQFLLPHLKDKSVICLYNSTEMLQNSREFHTALQVLLRQLTSTVPHPVRRGLRQKKGV